MVKSTVKYLQDEWAWAKHICMQTGTDTLNPCYFPYLLLPSWHWCRVVIYSRVLISIRIRISLDHSDYGDLLFILYFNTWSPLSPSLSLVWRVNPPILVNLSIISLREAYKLVSSTLVQILTQCVCVCVCVCVYSLCWPPSTQDTFFCTLALLSSSHGSQRRCLLCFRMAAHHTSCLMPSTCSWAFLVSGAICKIAAQMNVTVTK